MKNTALRMTFSRYVCLRRKFFHLTQKQVADHVGVSLNWIQKIESGKKLPSLSCALKLAFFLEFDMNDFFRDLFSGSNFQATASQLQKANAGVAAAKEPTYTGGTLYV